MAGASEMGDRMNFGGATGEFGRERGKFARTMVNFARAAGRTRLCEVGIRMSDDERE